jgi:hypothetical protein
MKECVGSYREPEGLYGAYGEVVARAATRVERVRQGRSPELAELRRAHLTARKACDRLDALKVEQYACEIEDYCIDRMGHVGAR